MFFFRSMFCRSVREGREPATKMAVMTRYLCILICVVALVMIHADNVHADSYEVVKIDGVVEYASGPPELLKLEKEGKINARALRAFDKLPEEYMSLALELRPAGINLLTADAEQLEQYVQGVEAGEIDADSVKMKQLQSHLSERGYLTWEPVQPGQELVAGDLVRAADGAVLTLRNDFGGEGEVKPSGIFVLSPDKLSFAWSVPSDPSAPSGTEAPGTSGTTPEVSVERPEQEKTSPIGPTPEGLSPLAAKLYEHWAAIFTAPGFPLQAAGPIMVVELLGGIDLDIPLVDYSLEEDDLSTNILQLRYESDLLGRMRYTMYLPKNVWLHDEYELPIGLLRFSRQDIKGVWLEELGGPTDLDVLLEQVVFLPDALTADGDEQAKVNVESIVVKSSMEENLSSLWNGEGFVQADNLRVIAPDNLEGFRIGSIRCQSSLQDHDYKVFIDMLPALLNVSDGLDDDLSAKLQKLLLGYGEVEFILSVSDVAMGEVDELEHFRLDRFEAKGAMRKSGTHPNGRSFHGKYEFQNFKLRTDTTDMNVDSFSLEAGLTDLDIKKVLQITDTDLFSTDNPFSAFDELLEGVHFDFSLTGLQGQHEDVVLSGPEDLALRVSVTGLSSPHPDMDIAYSHAGFKGSDMIPAELTPETLALALRLSRIPILQLAVTGMLAGEEALPLLFGLFAEQDSRLELDELHLAVPGGDIRMAGAAFADASSPASDDDIPVLHVETTLDIRGIDALAQSLATLMDDAEDLKHLNAVVAFIKLAADERMGDDGSTIHHLKISGNSHGEITANGKDLMPLLLLGAEE